MIRILLDRAFDNERHYIHAVGLSTDAKPTTGIITGSKFVAVDTGAGYLFDETTGEWNENQQLSEAVAAYLDEHPEALDVAAIEAMFGDQLDAIEAEQGVLKSALNDLAPSERSKGFELYYNDAKTGYSISNKGRLQSGPGYTVYDYIVKEGEIIYLNLSDNSGNVVYVFSSQSRIGSGSSLNPDIKGEMVSTSVNGYIEVPEGAAYLFVCQSSDNSTFAVKTTLEQPAGLLKQVYDTYDTENIFPVSLDFNGRTTLGGAAYDNEIRISYVPILVPGFLSLVWCNPAYSNDPTKTVSDIYFAVCKKVTGKYVVTHKIKAQSVLRRINALTTDIYLDGKEPYFIGYYGMAPIQIPSNGYAWGRSGKYTSSDDWAVGAELSITTFNDGKSLACIPYVLETNKQLNEEVSGIKKRVFANAAFEQEKYAHFSVDDCLFWKDLIDNENNYDSCFDNSIYLIIS